MLCESRISTTALRAHLVAVSTFARRMRRVLTTGAITTATLLGCSHHNVDPDVRQHLEAVADSSLAALAVGDSARLSKFVVDGSKATRLLTLRSRFGDAVQALASNHDVTRVEHGECEAQMELRYRSGDTVRTAVADFRCAGERWLLDELGLFADVH
jgi:hypothetical protein